MQVSSEMVGRDQELAKLEFHILKAVNGQGSVVNNGSLRSILPRFP